MAPVDPSWLIAAAGGWVVWSFAQGARNGFTGAMTSGLQALIVAAAVYATVCYIAGTFR